MYTRAITTALAKTATTVVLAMNGYSVIDQKCRKKKGWDAPELNLYILAENADGDLIAVATKGLAHVKGRTTVTGLSVKATERFDKAMAKFPEFTPMVGFTASFNNDYGYTEALLIPVEGLRKVAQVGTRFTLTEHGDRLMWDVAKKGPTVPGSMTANIQFDQNAPLRSDTQG